MLNIGDFARLGPVSPRMLRHYDQHGLLQPDFVDPATGYRFYSTAQLPQLHRILALRDLGFGIDDIAAVLHDNPSIDELKTLLRIRRNEIESALNIETDRLRRVEAQLRAIERNHEQTMQDIVIKHVPAFAVAETIETVAGYGYENIGPAYPKALPKLITAFEQQGLDPGHCVGYYETADDEGAVKCHIGFRVDNQSFTDTQEVHTVTLPETTVAALVHRGSFVHIDEVYESLFRWIDDSGYKPNGLCREMYLDWNQSDESLSVTELHVPITQ